MPGSIIEYSHVEAGDVRGWLDVRPLVLAPLNLRLQPRVRNIRVEHVLNGVVSIFVSHVSVRIYNGISQIIHS